MLAMFVFFFFQAEDGIRDWSVTGVQTCALPICDEAFPGHMAMNNRLVKIIEDGGKVYACRFALQAQIGRASCRERV